MTATLNMTSEDHHLPKTYVTVQAASPILPDQCVLYKAKAAAEIGEPQWIEDDGSHDLRATSSYSGCDFNWERSAWYWTPEVETAEQYRAWSSRRCSCSDTWVIRIQILMTFINSLRQSNLWFSKDWKEYVWHCKKKLPPPAKYDLYCQGDLIKGHICTGVQSSVARIKKEEVQTRMTEENVLTTACGKATQWAFIRYDSAMRLGMEIRGKIHIEIIAAEQM